MVEQSSRDTVKETEYQLNVAYNSSSVVQKCDIFLILIKYYEFFLKHFG